MQKVRFDIVACAIAFVILGIQVYTSFIRANGASSFLTGNDEIYQRAVFDDSDSKGVMHQVFRQNEVNREILKAILRGCGG